MAAQNTGSQNQVLPEADQKRVWQLQMDEAVQILEDVINLSKSSNAQVEKNVVERKVPVQ